MPPGKQTPLPASLSGEVRERLIRIDKSLLPYVAGALEWLTDKEPFDETGSLTVEAARELFSQMLWDFYNEAISMPMVGEYKMLAYQTVPDGWLLCRGAVVAQADYPALYAVIGGLYDTGGEGAGNFRLPDFSHRSPMGAPTNEYVAARGGSLTQTLTTPNLPPHNHRQKTTTGADSKLFVSGSGAFTNQQAAVGTTSDFNVTGDTGSAEPFSIIHPVLYANVIIYAGV